MFLSTSTLTLGRPALAGTPLDAAPPDSLEVSDTAPRKEVRAHRINPHAPRLDGKLDDEIWQKAEFISDFVQKEPREGAEPRERTEVAVAYDNKAIYIGARLFSDDPEALRMHLDRRDRQGPAEQFIVSIDSYCDRRTAYGFGVNTAGVRIDRYNPEDDEFYRDYTFDPVWEAKTHVDSAGWSTEMRIPLSQLRFNDRPEQTWGINFNRWIPERNEDVFWVYVPRNETGWASRFGNLTGLRGLRPSRRLEVLPYVSSNRSALTGDNALTRPHDQEYRAGGDLKLGVGPNMTLDATFNPDFGQVEADPAVVNLSQYEVFFDERRPFFLEGSQLLEGDGPGYYYSRRIGDRSPIQGAGQLTGRMASGTSLGLLAAVTERDPEVDRALTGFAVGRAQQQFGAYQSTVGGILTWVERDLESSPDLAASQRQRAVTGGTDWNLRFSKGAYELRGYAGFSRIEGSPSAILEAQESSARYYQRPDVDYVTLDPERTDLTGYTASMRLNKRAGARWLWALGGSVESPGFELNDLGSLNTSDDVSSWGHIAWRKNEPGPVFRQIYTELYGSANWNYGLSRQYSEVNLYSEVTWLNFYRTWLWYNRQFPGQNDAQTRGGPTMARESGHSFGGGINNGFTRTTQAGLSFNVGVDNLDGWLYRIGGDLSSRLGNRIQLSVSPSYQQEDQPRQYVVAIDTAGGGSQTYGTRYVFSRIAQTTISLSVRVNYFFTPDLSLELYGRPFAARGVYYGHGELVAAGGNDLRVYAEDPDATIRDTVVHIQDGQIDTTGEEAHVLLVDDGGTRFSLPVLDFNSIRYQSNLVLRWEFRRGSTLYLVWQRNLGDARPIDTPVNAQALWDSFSAEGENFFAFKVSYWIPL